MKILKQILDVSEKLATAIIIAKIIIDTVDYFTSRVKNEVKKEPTTSSSNTATSSNNQQNESNRNDEE